MTYEKCVTHYFLQVLFSRVLSKIQISDMCIDGIKPAVLIDPLTYKKLALIWYTIDGFIALEVVLLVKGLYCALTKQNESDHTELIIRVFSIVKEKHHLNTIQYRTIVQASRKQRNVHPCESISPPCPEALFFPFCS